MLRNAFTAKEAVALRAFSYGFPLPVKRTSLGNNIHVISAQRRQALLSELKIDQQARHSKSQRTHNRKDM